VRRAAIALSFALMLAGCPTRSREPTGPFNAVPAAPKPVERGAPLDFVLDPLDRDFEHYSESEVLRGKRAIVLILATYDVGSLLALRTLAPLLNGLPSDAACLQVALQPIGDKPLIGPFMDAEMTPCRRAIGDPKRGRLGDLAKVQLLPTVLVLRADGTLAGARSGTISLEEIRTLLDEAK
jgi:hypothetical protein